MSREKLQSSFYERVMRASIWTGGLVALYGAVYVGPRYALVYLLFLGWTLVNLALWRPFLRGMLRSERRAGQVLPLGMLKIVWLFLLFVLGYFYIGVTGERKTLNFLAFLLGFNTPFLVALLKAGGQYLTRKSDTTLPREWPDVLDSSAQEGKGTTEE
jgi:hypothetical protein